MSRQALSGIKVLEFSEFIAGPYCGKLMTHMGAQVIKVEKPGLGDKARNWGPFPENIPHPDKSGLYMFLNAGKNSITLNIETTTGLKIFKELIKKVDIVVEDNAPARMSGLGLSYGKFKRLNPSLIMTSITPFGQTGPFKNYKGNDLIASHSGAEAFGNPDEGVIDPDKQPPLKVANHGADFMVGITAAVCTLGAAITQLKSGLGQHIDLSQQEAVASICRQQLAYFAVQGQIPSREFGRKKFGGFLYPCKDGHVVIWIGPHYHLVVRMMENPDWADEEMFANPILRNQYIVELNQLISAWTIEHTTREINDLALAHGVPCSPVRSVKELVDDEQLDFRKFWEMVDYPVIGRRKFPGLPFKLSATPGRIEFPAPSLGEHNEIIYCRMLGYNRADLVRMRQGGII